MQIDDNFLNDGHLPPEIPRTDDRYRVPPCRPPHASNTSFKSVSQRSSGRRHSVLWNSRCRPPGWPPTSLTATAVWHGWSSEAAGPHASIFSWPFVIDVPSSLRNPKYHQSLIFRLFGSSISMYVEVVTMLFILLCMVYQKTNTNEIYSLCSIAFGVDLGVAAVKST